MDVETKKISEALLALETPIFGFPVKMPSFIIGEIPVSASGVQLNYLSTATGTTGNTAKKIVFSENPTFGGYVNMPGDGIWDALGRIGAKTLTPRRNIDSLSVLGPQIRASYADNTYYADLEANSAGNLVLRPSGHKTLIPTADTLASDDWVSRLTGWGIYKMADGRSGGADFREMNVDELHANKFISDLEMALAGSQIISKSVAILYADVVIPAKGASVTIYVEDLPGTTSNVFADNDWVQLRLFERDGAGFTIANAWGQVTFVVHHDAAGSEPGYQEYTFARDAIDTGTADGETATKGSLVLDFGVSGDGFVETTAIDSTGSPYQQMVTWTTKPWTQTVRNRIGNLYGITGSDEWGLIAGSFANKQYLLASDTHFELHGIDLSLYDGVTNTVKLSRTGLSFAMGPALPTGFLVGTGIWMGKDTDYKFRVGSVAGGALVKGISWDGTDFTVKGTIISDAGSIGGWTINSTYLAKDSGVDATSAGMSPTDYPFYAGATYANRATGGFKVAVDGSTTVKDMYITGLTDVYSGNFIPAINRSTGKVISSALNMVANTFSSYDFMINTSGILRFPILTNTQINSIPSPSRGSVVFNDTDKSFYGYTGTAWRKMNN